MKCLWKSLGFCKKEKIQNRGATERAMIFYDARIHFMGAWGADTGGRRR